MACSFDAALKTIDALISNTKLSNKREGLLSIKARIERMRDTAKVQSSAGSYDKVTGEKIAKTTQKPQKDTRTSTTRSNFTVQPKADLNDKVTTVVRTFDYDIANPPKATEIVLKDLVALALVELTLLETEVNTKRTELQNKIAKYGVNVSNLVTGDNEGSYVTGGKAKAETKVEDDTIQEDNKDKIFTALQALLGKSGKKELDRLATMMKDC